MEKQNREIELILKALKNIDSSCLISLLKGSFKSFGENKNRSFATD
jgi:hypothetical protein